MAGSKAKRHLQVSAEDVIRWNFAYRKKNPEGNLAGLKAHIAKQAKAKKAKIDEAWLNDGGMAKLKSRIQPLRSKLTAAKKKKFALAYSFPRAQRSTISLQERVDALNEELLKKMNG